MAFDLLMARYGFLATCRCIYPRWNGFHLRAGACIRVAANGGAALAASYRDQHLFSVWGNFSDFFPFQVYEQPGRFDEVIEAFLPGFGPGRLLLAPQGKSPNIPLH
jgi:hypothetical protein